MKRAFAVAALLFLALVSLSAHVMEYKVVAFTTTTSVSTLQIALNQLGAEGWVLVTAYSGPNNAIYYVFSREKPQPSLSSLPAPMGTALPSAP
ncbi:MAG TPA: hypothetical protein VIO60_07470 [Rectinemataceae bacterium]